MRVLGRPLPGAHELALVRALAPMVAQVRATARLVETPADARRLGVALRRAWPDKRIAALVASVGSKVEVASSRPWLPLVRAMARAAARRDAAEFDGEKLVAGWTTEATGLIKSVRDEVAEQMRKEVVEALEKGTPHSELAARWIARGIPVKFGTLEGRMRVIAKHQVSYLNAQVTKTRAGALGIEMFRWKHSGATRFRPHHKARDGFTFSYADPPELPGEAPNCGCWAESVIPEDLVEGLGLEGVIEVG